MASSKPLDIVARFRTVTTDFNTREVERELSDADRAFIASEKAAGRWATKVRRSADDAVPRKGSGRWRGAGQDLGSEFAQNIGEGVSSGKAGIAGAVDTALGTLGGFLPALGPAGAAVGIGFLLIKSVVDGVNAQAQAERTRLREVGKSLYGAFQDGILDASEKEAALQDLFGVDDFKAVTDAIVAEAKVLRVPAADLLAYYKSFGDVVTPALRDAFEKAERTTGVGIRGIGIAAEGGFRDVTAKVKGRVADLDTEVGKVKGALDTELSADDIISETALREADARTRQYISAWEQRWKDLTDAHKAYRTEVAKPVRFGSPTGAGRSREP